MNKIVFLDIETNKLDPATAVPIQIAALAVISKTFEVIDEFEAKVKFDLKTADPKALLRNSYNKEVWENEAVAPHVVATTLEDFFDRHATWARRTISSGRRKTWCEVAGHNITFYDGPILNRWLYSLRGVGSVAAFWTTGPLDTMHWAKAKEFERGLRFERGLSLGALCKYFNIKIENEHDALADVIATVELAKRLAGIDA